MVLDSVVCLCVSWLVVLGLTAQGWSGGAMVLGKLPVPGRPTNLDWGRARAYCTCSRCGWGVVWTFLLSSILSFLFLPLFWETARYILKYCLKGPLSPKQLTNQLNGPLRQYFSLYQAVSQRGGERKKN